MAEAKQPIIDWEPAPGCVLVKPVQREELAVLYNQAGASKLSLPDNVGKVSDSVGVGRVVKCGIFSVSYIEQLKTTHGDDYKQTREYKEMAVAWGDYIAYMPFTDLLIEIDGIKYALVEYKNIRAVRKANDGKS